MKFEERVAAAVGEDQGLDAKSMAAMRRFYEMVARGDRVVMFPPKPQPIRGSLEQRPTEDEAGKLVRLCDKAGVVHLVTYIPSPEALAVARRWLKDAP
jgi:hypothetical protein